MSQTCYLLEIDCLIPVEWYYPTAASSGIPCRWAGLLNLGHGLVYYEVVAYGV